MPVKLEHVLKRVETLPILPTSAMRVMSLTKNPDIDVNALADLIGQDPALAASILRQANSALYGYARRIASLAEAVVLLGFQTIYSLTLSAAVAPMLKTELTGYCLDQEGLWKHSLLVGLISRKLCRRLHLPIGETAFTAGLLHDIGKLILSIYVQEVGGYLLKKIEQQKLSYVEMEQKVIGFDHATVGGFIIKHWNLPEPLVDAITHHHHPEKSVAEPVLAAVIHVANVLANTLGVGGGIDSFLNPLRPESLALLKLKEEDIDLLLADLGDLMSDPNIFG